ncbi:hypothetical protein B0T21DRAFT_448559 [Apiosordaria backusii]|uniref:Uncharacterized protein n=1 Tax=Apiosordaria backusii TaxID=314023 RepID=A0AA40ELU7_9PEZI|nr:hypothetical protein B0T21DRAFT_448559 [Apiosordaria backusii]
MASPPTNTAVYDDGEDDHASLFGDGAEIDDTSLFGDDTDVANESTNVQISGVLTLPITSSISSVQLTTSSVLSPTITSTDGRNGVIADQSASSSILNNQHEAATNSTDAPAPLGRPDRVKSAIYLDDFCQNVDGSARMVREREERARQAEEKRTGEMRRQDETQAADTSQPTLQPTAPTENKRKASHPAAKSVNRSKRPRHNEGHRQATTTNTFTPSMTTTNTLTPSMTTPNSFTPYTSAPGMTTSSIASSTPWLQQAALEGEKKKQENQELLAEQKKAAQKARKAVTDHAR